VEDSESLSAVADDLDSAKALGISSVPTIVINGRTYAGTKTYQELAALIVSAKSDGDAR
jgi:predicted DsbA family dithiol-disulfide isomerase